MFFHQASLITNAKEVVWQNNPKVAHESQEPLWVRLRPRFQIHQQTMK